MLFWLSKYLMHFDHAFRVFEYISLRAILATVTSLLVSLCMGPLMIRSLEARNLGQPIRALGPADHQSKSGTPTMGGVLIIASVLLSTLLWAKLEVLYVWIALAAMLAFGFLGGLDDYFKLKLNNSDGLSAKVKLFWQSVIAIGLAFLLYHHHVDHRISQIVVPFTKQLTVDIGVGFLFLAYFVIVGTSNAVNLTDGLDGLAVMPIVFVACGLGVFAYLTGNIRFSSYLMIPYVPGVGELTIFCAALVGSGLGFLWFNTYPAQVFMGDVGSLGLGAAIGVVALMVRQEIALIIMGGIFVIEAMSVILQVGSYKLFGRRMFRMAPLHHHFELKGWPEPKVIVRFWIISLVLVLIGLATLKLR